MIDPGTRWALLMEYDGTGLCGWQRQDDAPSVQAILEQAAARATGCAVDAAVAGRTDAGVHAAAQVAMVAMPSRFNARSVRDALNFHMKPHPVVVIRAVPAPDKWHPRFAATGRTYRYVILNRRARPGLLRHRAWHIPVPLDIAAMNLGAAHLLGWHDFSSFRAAACQAKSPLRTLDRLDVERHADRVDIVAEARSFLHHQVRNMVGSLVQVGAGRWPTGRIADVLAARSRAVAGPTAPPDGLTLTGVRYELDPFAGPAPESD